MDFAILADSQHCYFGWGASEQASSSCKNAFYINDFALSDKRPWVLFEHTKTLELPYDLASFKELRSALAELPKFVRWEEAPLGEFSKLFNLAQDNFSQKVLRKVLVSLADLAHEPRSELCFRNNTLPNFKHTFYAFKLGDTLAWGITPELLFEIEGKVLKTMALAGTYVEQQESRLTPEHDEVLGFFRDLARDMNLDISVGATHSDGFSTLKHLKSEVLFKNIPERSLDVWIQNLHPTPALGVSPRSECSLQVLSQFRQNIPSYFGAPMGFVGEKKARFYVMIRGVFSHGKNFYRPIGVGVTSASSLEAEWNEVEVKRKAMEELWKQII